MPRLSLSMIVRDEARHLERALATARLYADEIVVVDTGSKDGTREIAARLADRVFDFPWVDDFAAARNFSADRCTGELLMWLDADDVVPPEAAKALRRVVDRPSSWDLLRVPYELGEGRGVVNLLPRLWRAGRGIRWTYPIHELLDAGGRRLDNAPEGVRVLHRPIAVEGSRQHKHERNLRILRRALDGEHRESAHLWFHLAKELRGGDAAEQQQAVDALARALSLEPERGTFLRSRQHLAMGEILHRLGRDDEALQALGLCIGEYPLWREPYFVMSEIMRSRRQRSAAVGLLRLASGLERHESHVNRAELYGPEWARIVSVALEEAGEVPQALEEIRVALRRAPDDAALLEREEELVVARDLAERPPRLMAIDLAPREVRRGESLEATFTLHTRIALPFALGLSLRDAHGGVFSDPAHDEIVACPVGESRQRRLFTVPPDAPAGPLTVETTLRLVRRGRLDRSLDRLTLPNAVVAR